MAWHFARLGTPVRGKLRYGSCCHARSFALASTSTAGILRPVPRRLLYTADVIPVSIQPGRSSISKPLLTRRPTYRRLTHRSDGSRSLSKKKTGCRSKGGQGNRPVCWPSPGTLRRRTSTFCSNTEAGCRESWIWRSEIPSGVHLAIQPGPGHVWQVPRVFSCFVAGNGGGAARV